MKELMLLVLFTFWNSYVGTISGSDLYVDHISYQLEKGEVMLKMLGNRVLARYLPTEEKMNGVLILPDSAKEKQEVAEVIAIGLGKITTTGEVIEIPLKIADKILVEKYQARSIVIDSEEYFVVDADKICAILE